MSQRDKPWAIVPVKQFDNAKQRLAGALSAQVRRALAQAMLEDVLSALANCDALAGIAVVTIDPQAAAISRRHDARILTDAATGGHTAAVVAAAERLAREGSTAVLSVPGDIPLITADEVTQVVAAFETAPAFVIVPAHDERGSNAVLCAPPGAVALSYGDDSFLPHLAAARAAGIEPAVLRLPGIALDVDHPADLKAFLAKPSDTRAYRLLVDARSSFVSERARE